MDNSAVPTLLGQLFSSCLGNIGLFGVSTSVNWNIYTILVYPVKIYIGVHPYSIRSSELLPRASSPSFRALCGTYVLSWIPSFLCPASTVCRKVLLRPDDLACDAIIDFETIFGIRGRVSCMTDLSSISPGRKGYKEDIGLQHLTRMLEIFTPVNDAFQPYFPQTYYLSCAALNCGICTSAGCRARLCDLPRLV